MAEVATETTEHAGWRARPGAFLAWLRAGEFNPVFVKEMRQAVRGQLVLGGFLATLFVMFSAYAWQLFTTDLRERGGGVTIFATTLGMLTLLTCVCVTGWSATRMTQERHGEEGVDLLYFTPMPAEEIIWGKVKANALLAAVFFSAGAPFLALTPQFGGVDIVTVICLTTLNYFAVVCVSQIGMLLASMAVPRVLKWLFSLGAGLGGLLFTIFWGGLCFAQVASFGGGKGIPLWAFTGMTLVFGFLLLNAAVAFTASNVAPANGIYFRRRPPEVPPPLPPPPAAPTRA